MVFNPKEVATLTVNGRVFRDWKSITVYLCQKESHNYYRFTCSEAFTVGAPPKSFAEMLIRPGDTCTVLLGGQYAIGGYVKTRQVADTEKSHGVEITGATYTFATVSGGASVKGGELTNVSFTQLATQVLQPFGIGFMPKGGISEEKFDRVNVTGQSAWEVIETAARQRNVVLGTNPYEGQSYWGTVPGYTEGGAWVTEGVNILEGRETISVEFGSGAYLSLGQFPPKPDQWGPIVTSQPLGNHMSNFMSRLGVGAGMFMPLVNMAELPGKQGDAGQRSQSENTALSGEQIKLEIVVQGWFTPGGELWRPWMMVQCTCPMLLVNRPLICRSVTFTQDDKSGTRTTLELWNEEAEKRAKLD